MPPLPGSIWDFFFFFLADLYNLRFCDQFLTRGIIETCFGIVVGFFNFFLVHVCFFVVVAFWFLVFCFFFCLQFLFCHTFHLSNCIGCGCSSLMEHLPGFFLSTGNQITADLQSCVYVSLWSKEISFRLLTLRWIFQVSWKGC